MKRAACLMLGWMMAVSMAFTGYADTAEQNRKYEDAEPVCAMITPVPGGVGSVTTTVLMEHVVDAAMKTLES